MQSKNLKSEEEVRLAVEAAIGRLPAHAPRKEKTRLVANLLFLEHGIYPSAKVVLDYTHQGSLTDINKDLREFWAELRDKLRVNINAPFLPQGLTDAFADGLVKIWDLALGQANAELDGLRQQAAEQVALAQADAFEASRLLKEEQERRITAEADLRVERENREAAERRVDAQAAEIAGLRESLEHWQRQSAEEAQARKDAEERFSRELEAERAQRTHESERFNGEIRFVKLQIETARSGEREARELLKAMSESKDLEVSTYRQRLSSAEETLGSVRIELAQVQGRAQALERQLNVVKEREISVVQKPVTRAPLKPFKVPVKRRSLK